jgi:hypothetical protein
MIRVQELQICDVCRLLDGDEKPKVCFYCSMCDANICQQDSWRWDRRARAFLRKRQQPGFKGDPNYKTGDAEADKIIEKGELPSP